MNEVKHTPLIDAAIVCERGDMYGSTHRKLAREVREINAAIAEILADAITGEAPSGFVLVPVYAYTRLSAALTASQGDQHGE